MQFSRVGFAPCLRSWLTMLVCKRWDKHNHFSLNLEKHVIADLYILLYKVTGDEAVIPTFIVTVKRRVDMQM